MNIHRKYAASDLTFAICAYKKSDYLEECIQSVMDQTVVKQKEGAKVLIATSTPCDYISDLADKYSIPLFVNEKDQGHSNIGNDWNYCYSCADTELVTIAHQDDIYYPDYGEKILKNLNRKDSIRPLIAFTDYAERRNGQDVTDNKLLSVKRKLLAPLRNPKNWSKVSAKRRVLSLGCPICCPSVTYVAANLPRPVFRTDLKNALDWQTWERFSKLDGSFVYCNEPLMAHRIHEDSETTNQIAGGGREREDLEMLCKFWPKPIASLIEHFYKASEKSNSL